MNASDHKRLAVKCIPSKTIRRGLALCFVPRFLLLGFKGWSEFCLIQGQGWNLPFITLVAYPFISPVGIKNQHHLGHMCSCLLFYILALFTSFKIQAVQIAKGDSYLHGFNYPLGSPVFRVMSKYCSNTEIICRSVLLYGCLIRSTEWSHLFFADQIVCAWLSGDAVLIFGLRNGW